MQSLFYILTPPLSLFVSMHEHKQALRSSAELLCKQSYCRYYSAPVLPSRVLSLQSIWVFMVHDTIMIKMLASNSEEDGAEREWEEEEGKRDRQFSISEPLVG